MVITVGIAYGSDIAVARNLLLKAATGGSSVPVADPPVAAVLDQFGDSTLISSCDFSSRDWKSSGNPP